VPRRYPAEFRRKVLDLVEAGRPRPPTLMHAYITLPCSSASERKKRASFAGIISILAAGRTRTLLSGPVFRCGDRCKHMVTLRLKSLGAPSRSQPVGKPTGPDTTRMVRSRRRTLASAISDGGVHTRSVIPFGRPEASRPRCGTLIAHGTVGGRTTWWCPHEPT
jgi:hypothetical protein